MIIKINKRDVKLLAEMCENDANNLGIVFPKEAKRRIETLKRIERILKNNLI